MKTLMTTTGTAHPAPEKGPASNRFVRFGVIGYWCLSGAWFLAAGASSLNAAEATNSAPPRRGFQQQLTSPEVHADRRVTFRVRAPNATNVSVSGEWGSGSKAM